MDEYGTQPVLQKVVISPVTKHIDLLGKRRPESGRGDEAAASAIACRKHLVPLPLLNEIIGPHHHFFFVHVIPNMNYK